MLRSRRSQRDRGCLPTPCIRWQGHDEVRTFQTTTVDLLRLSEWLAANDCTHVAMEATGVYWKPVWHILDDGEFELVLANAAHVKNVPGRKTDVNDAMWLAELLAHGLIRASFVPDTQTQEMRNLLRTRKQLVREQSSHVLRVQKTLEDANIKLDSVLSDLMGKSGRAMIEALIAGETNPAKPAALADRRVKASHEEFREALRGRVTKHHRFLLRLHLNQIDALDAAMATLDTQVEANLGPFRTAVELIMSIPGIKNLGAHVIVSEIGIDMSRFPSDAHLISWAGICPRNDESAGKRRSNRLRKGAPWLKTTLVQCAWAAVKKKNSYLQAQFTASKPGAAPRRRSWPSQPPSLPLSTTCSRMGRCTRTSAAITSIAVQPTSKNNAWLNASLNWVRCGDQAHRRLEPCLRFFLEIARVSDQRVGGLFVEGVVGGQVGHPSSIVPRTRQGLTVCRDPRSTQARGIPWPIATQPQRRRLAWVVASLRAIPPSGQGAGESGNGFQGT